MKTLHTINTNFAKRFAIVLFFLTTLGLSSAWAATGTLSISRQNGTILDSQGNTWTITTVGTTSNGTTHGEYYQIGSASSPAISITLTMTFPTAQKVIAFSGKFSGYDSEAKITFKVGNTVVGEGALTTSHSTSNPVTFNSTYVAVGNTLTVSVTNITNAVNIYNLSYTYESATTQEVTWIVDGEEEKADIPEGTIEISKLPTDPDNCSSEVVFVGWTANPNVDGSRPADLFNRKTPNSNLPIISSTNNTFYAVYATQIEAASLKTDLINLATTGVTGTSYESWSKKTVTSDAVYAGYTAKESSSIKLNDENQGIFTTTSGGKVKKVVVIWDSGTTNGRTLNIYGSNTRYEAASDLFDVAKQGTLLGTIVKGTSTELIINGDYEYIGLRSNKSAMYLTSIAITWESEGSFENYTTTCSVDVTVTLNPNGGTGDFTDDWTLDGSKYTQTVEKGNSVTLPTLDDQTAYTFGGWSDGTEIHSAGPYTVEADVELTAVWNARPLTNYRTSCSYTVIWQANGGQWSDEITEDIEEYNVGETITPPDDPTRDGYRFMGWSEDGATIVAPKTTMPAEDLIYIAVWEEEYSVTYDSNGGTTICEDNNKYIEDETVTVCATEPTKIGYTFAGWNDGTNTYQADGQFTMPANNVTLTALWTANTNTPYMVEHYQEALDGSYTLVETDALTGTTDAEVTPATKTYEGFTSPDPQTVKIAADGSLVVKYQYTRNSYQLTWDPNGGNWGGSTDSKVDTYNYGASITKPADPTRTGYTFAGWKPAVPATMPAEDQTFIAIWENCRWVETTTIEDGDEIVFIMVDNPTSTSYAMNNEVTSTDPLAVVINTDIFSSGSVPNNIIWDIQKDANGIVFYSKTAADKYLRCNAKPDVRVGVGANNTFTLDKGYIQSLSNDDSYLAVATGANIKCWRQYGYSSNNITNQTLKLYKRICLDDTKHWVTWDANGGLFADGSATKTDFFTVGATITHPANPTREGWTFTGWAPETNTMPNEDIAFVAQWQVNTFTVTWNANGGKFGNETSVEQSYPYGATITAPTPTRIGYTFAGWDSEVPATMPASNLTYNAQWNCTSPTDIKINGAYIVFPGETIELTVTGNNIADDATYQWYKKNGDSYDELEEQTTNTLRIDNCVVGDAANYKCVVTNGTCSAESNFTVKMYRLRGLTDPENSWTTDFVFSKAEGKTATYEITLNGASNYKFKVHDGSAYYGNNEGGDNPNPTMTHDNCTNWTMQENKGYNVILQTTITGVYTFVLNYTDESNPKISVIYPSKKMVYLNPGDWTSSKYAVYAWNGNTNNTYLMTKVDDCTDRNIYQAEIDATYNNVIFIGGNASYNVSNPWTNVERQTIDLTYPSDDKLLYELNTTHLFLKPNTNWKKDGARFAAYFFDNGEAWVSMTKVNDDLYKVQIPTNKTYPSVIFCRMNPSAAANNWDNKWNQSADLTITKGNNHYTIEERDDNWSDGTWKTAGSWTDFIPYYTISYNMNGHGTQISDDCIEDGDAWSAPTDPTEVGYTFEGWRRPATTGDNTLYKNGQAGFTPTSNEELTAQWTFAMEYNITNAEPVFITSAVGQTIKGTTPLTLAVSNMPVGTEITISAPHIKFYFGGEEVTTLTNKHESETLELIAAYTPENANTTEQPTITLDVLGYEKEISDKISCRSLPATFAIVAKVGNLWYALPSQGLNSTDDLMGYAIEVDNQNDPTVVTAVPENADWSLRQVYAGQNANATKDRFKQYGNNLVFVNSDVKALNASSSGSHVLTDAQYTNYYDQYPGRYEWTPMTTDLETYQLTNAERDRKLSIDILTRFGVYAGEITDMRFLPIQNRYTPAALQVVEWKENSVVIMYNGDPAQTATLAIDGTTQIGAANLNDVKKDVAIYELPASGLVNNATQRLLITIGSSKKWLTIPYIINNSTTDVNVLNSTNTNKAVAAVTDVVVLNDATFTAAGTKNDKYTFRTIHVYGGGKLVVPASAAEGLGIYSLVMRSGTIENGTYTNSYPQLVMNGKYSNTSGIYLDYITTYERYYALSVPYSVKTKNIKYPADIYGDNLKDGGNRASFALQYYNGAARATGASGWKDFDESGDDPTLSPYQGYTFWGAPRKVSVNGGAMERQKYGIHRIQLTGSADALLTAETSDKTIDIIAYPAERPNDMGWNFLGNPYLAQYGGLSADNELVQVGLLEQEMIDGKWTGGWKHTGNLRYITTTTDGQTYTPVEVDKATFSPFNTFFIQAATNGALSFVSASRAQSLPARHYAAQQETAKEITTGIILTGNDQTDRTGLLIADNFTEEYDFNADLSKFENSGINLYTIGKDGKLAFMAINQALAEQPIPLGYGAPADGEYTIAFDEDRYNATDISALYLIDYDRNETTNLLHTDYSFVTAAGTNNERFALQVAFIPQNATSVEWVDDATIQVAVDGNNLLLNNLPTDAGVQVFDALGRVIYATPNAPTEMQITLPTGYYLVRIADKQHAVVINTVIP